MSQYDYAVFKDVNRHTCIRLSEIHGKVSFIPLTSGEFQIITVSAKEFVSEYVLMAEYPVKRAAEYYISISSKVGADISSKAREHLERIVADPSLEYDRSQFNPVPKPLKKEDIMAKGTAKEAPAKKAAPKAPAKVSVTVDKIERAPKSESGPRVSQYAGKKIAKLADHTAREGSIRAAILNAILKAKNTDAVLGTEVTSDDGSKTEAISPGHLAWAVKSELISLG